MRCRPLTSTRQGRWARVLVCTGLLGCASESAPDAPQNLLVIAVDTLRADALGIYGAPDERSPHIDSLGKAGIVFESAVSHASWTLPSFAATLTSTYTSTNGCWTFEARLPESFETLPEVFQAAGFETYGIASHIFFNQKYGLQQGFDSFDESLGHRANEAGWEPLTSPKVSERAVDWIEARAGSEQPWLLWLHYFDPHIPYYDHAKAAGLGAVADERTRYESEIQFTDRFVGEVLAALESSGFGANTAVLFLSDHGEAFYEHEDVRRHSHSLFQEELRVPLLLKVPGLEPRRVAGLTRTVDLMPTLLELFRLKAKPGQMVGRSLLPSLLGESQKSEPLLAEIRLKTAPKGKHSRAVLDGRWKLIEGLDGSFVLFDTQADPLEQNDLAASHGAEVQRLRSMMQALEARAKEAGKAFEPGSKVQQTEDEADQINSLGYGAGDEDEEAQDEEQPDQEMQLDTIYCYGDENEE